MCLGNRNKYHKLNYAINLTGGACSSSSSHESFTSLSSASSSSQLLLITGSLESSVLDHFPCFFPPHLRPDKYGRCYIRYGTPFSFFVVMVLKIASRGKTKSSSSNLPPGPRELPFIGNIHQLAGSLPHRSLRNLANKYGPLMHLRLGEVSTVVVSSAEFAKEVMKTHDATFASRPHLLAADIVSYNSTNIVFAKYGDYWRQLRKICTLEVLSPKRVQSYRPIREEEMLNLIKWIASKARSPINLTEKNYSSTYTITTRAAFGKKSKYHEEFIDAVKEGIQLAGGFDLADVFPSYSLLHMITGMRPKLQRLQKKTDRILENIIKEHTEKATSH